MKTPRSGTTSLALALLFAIGATSICAAKTFVYVSNAQDGNIDAYTMDTSTGSLTPIGKAEAGKLVMPMAVSPNKKHLYAVVRSQPPRVLTYAIDPATGALTQKASAPLPDSMPYVSTDRTGFTASYGDDKLAVSPISEDGLVEAEAIQVIPTGRNAHSILPDRSNKFVYAATLGANQVLQFTFDSKTGKLTPNDPAAVQPRGGSRAAPHGVLARQQEPLCTQRVVGARHAIRDRFQQGDVDPRREYQLGTCGRRPRLGYAAGARRRCTDPGCTAEGREAESLGGRYPNHAQRQVPVFHRAYHQQDRLVHCGT